MPIAFCTGPDPIDITIAKMGLDENPDITRVVLQHILEQPLTSAQIEEIDNILNRHLEQTNPNNPHRVFRGQIQNAVSLPSNTVITTGPQSSSEFYINTGLIVLIGVTTAYLIYRNWDFFGSFFSRGVEQTIQNPEPSFNLARRVAFVSTNHPDVIREVYLVLRRH